MSILKSRDHASKRLESLAGLITETHAVATSDRLLHDYESGSTIFLNASDNSDIKVVLPAPRIGLNFVVINAVSPAGTGDVVITNAGGTGNMVVQGPPATYTEGLPEIVTFTFAGPLVANNKVNVLTEVDTFYGNPSEAIPEREFDASSDATLQTIADKLAALSVVFTAVVTVVGGNQTGNDDRVITITG